MRVEETCFDVLQNIEFAIANEYRLNPALRDRDALEAVQELIRQYAAEARRQRHLPSVHLAPSARAVFDSVQTMCEFRLGRTANSAVSPIDHQELLSCLKRIRESIQHWTGEHGARGYLNFIKPFLLRETHSETAAIQDGNTGSRQNDIPRDVWRRLYDLSIQVWELAPWKWMTEQDVFGVQMPGNGETIFVSITGMRGEYFAVIVYPNADAVRSVWSLEDDAPPERILDITQIHASFDSARQSQKDERRLIDDLGFRFKGCAWPNFRSYRPGFAPWSIEPGEAEMLIAAMEQLLDVAPRVRADSELLWPEREEDACLVRVPPGNDAASWKDEIREIAPSRASYVDIELDPDSVDRCRRARQAQNEIEVDLFPLQTAVSDGGGRPRVPYTLLMVDSETGIILGHEMLMVETSLQDMWARVPGRIVEKLRNLGVRPTSLAVRSGPIAVVVQAVAEVLGLRVRVGGNLSTLDSAKDHLISYMRV